MNSTHRLAAACAVLASVIVLTGVTAGAVKAQTCDLSATTSDFTDKVDAAADGDTLCLASGDYGPWDGARKTITLTPDTGATPTIGIDFDCGTGCSTLSQADGPTLDGLTITGGRIVGDTNFTSFANEPQNITIRNSTFTGSLVIDAVQDANILLDGNTHEDIDYPDTGPGTVDCNVPPAAIHLPYRDAIESGVTIQNSRFAGGNKDGIQGSAGVEIIGNEFTDIHNPDVTCDDHVNEPHTDPLQLTGASGSVVRDNWLHGNDDGIGAFDGLSDVTIENNVIGPDQGGHECMSLYSTIDTVVRHNTCSAGLGIYLGRASGKANSSGNTIVDNVVPYGLNGPDMPAGATKTTNLYAGASAPDVDGSPTFVCGSSPTSYAGFQLTNSSDGRHGASDGRDIGVIYDTPTAAFTFSPSAPTTGQQVTFDASATMCEDTPCTYHWHDIGAGGTGNSPLGTDGQTSQYTFTSSGTKYVELVVTDDDGDISKVEHDVVVAPASPTLVTETQVSSWTTIDASKTTSSFSAQAGDVIVVSGMTEDQPISLSVSGGSLTWTQLQQVNVSGYGRAYAWTATVDSNKTMSVTCTRGALSGSYGCDALLFRGSAGAGASAKANVASGNPSLSLTTVGDNSAVVVGDVDWNAASGSSRTWRTTAGAFTEKAYATLTGHYTIYGGLHPDVDAAGAKTVGLTTPSQKYSIVAVEVQGA